ncbi:MAG: SDR family NAD(P)-dependent oxidoreductase, partial [Steroidobacteraceae bacterium]
MSVAAPEHQRFRAAPDELCGRVIAVTGAGDGIGRAVALAAAAHGAEVVLIGRTVAKLEAVHASIAALKRSPASIAPLDLEQALARDYDQLADALQARYGRLDGLLHNAGLLGVLAPIEQYDVPTWCRVLHVNLTAAFALTQVLLPLLRAASDASIVFTASGVGREPRAYWGAYAVSKG